MSKWADLFGTTLSYLRLGLTGVRLKDSGGNLVVRNPGDTADATITTSKLFNSSGSIEINSDAAGTGNDHKLTLQQSSSQTSALTLTFPADNGTAGYILSTNGAGTLSWIAVGSTADKISTDTTALAFGSTSPVTMFTLPANAVIIAIRVIVDTAFNGTPTLSIGISGTTSKYVASTQVALTAVGIYEIYPGIAASGSTEALIATYASGSASVGAARIEVDYSVPT